MAEGNLMRGKKVTRRLVLYEWKALKERYEVEAAWGTEALEECRRKLLRPRLRKMASRNKLLMAGRA